MTTRVHRGPKTAQCQCGAAATDWGELEEHVISAGATDHYPVDPEHVTDQIRDAHEVEQRKMRTREALAQAAGVSMAELREALR